MYLLIIVTVFIPLSIIKNMTGSCINFNDNTSISHSNFISVIKCYCWSRKCRRFTCFNIKTPIYTSPTLITDIDFIYKHLLHNYHRTNFRLAVITGSSPSNIVITNRNRFKTNSLSNIICRIIKVKV